MKRDTVSLVERVVTLVVCLGLLTACSLITAPPPISTTAVASFTDFEAVTFMLPLATIGATQPGTDLRALILDKIKVDIWRLRRITGIIGNCISIDYYDLSPSYELVVDTNACYEGGVTIVKKGSDGASRLITASPN